MCGIVGFLDANRATGREELEALVAQMASTIYRRGPDAGGVWVDAEAGVALGHRRLSILDLSADGNQPMRSNCGNYVIVFNGEIYNHKDIHQELVALGHRFRSQSDTEVLLLAIAEWGLEIALKKSVGMFAIAVWDVRRQLLSLARDRMGEKPLYYGWIGSTFFFGSELKALLPHPLFRADIDRDALSQYVRHNYVPAPRSIYRRIYKLMPGTSVTVNTRQPGVLPKPTEYWSVRSAAEQGIANLLSVSDAEAIQQLDQLLRGVIRRQMVADVRLGAFLSGGVDSSTVAALMQVQSSQPVRTFSIGFREEGYNEAEYAKAVARHLGTDHTELYVTPEEAQRVLPLMPMIYDEPFADSSQIPTFLVSRLARQDVTVSLSGDGGDELFGGYARYQAVRELWGKLRWMPGAVRRLIATTLKNIDTGTLDRSMAWMGPFLNRYSRPGAVGEKLHRIGKLLGYGDLETVYRAMVSHCTDPEKLVLGAREPLSALQDSTRWANLRSPFDRMMFLDMISYLPDDILVKLDRAGMGVSLECRVPLLDHRVVEMAWRVPFHMKVRGGQSKWLLRQVLYQYVPRELIDRPKMGFGVPIGAWLRSDLREWAEALLSETRLRREGFFEPTLVREKWEEHLTGMRNWQYDLWDVLMFQAWHEETRRAQASSVSGMALTAQ